MIEIKVKGTERLTRKLQAYQKSLEKKMYRLMEELAKLGIDIAEVRFQKAQYDGDNDVIVAHTPEWVNESKLAIVASGSAVTFIEFGTGVHYVEQHPKSGELGFIRGTYGKGMGSRDFWEYYGNPGTNGEVKRENEKGTLVKTHGNPPARAMYDSAKEMRDQILDVAREVFSK